MKFVLFYIILSNAHISTGSIEMKTLFACEQAAAQMAALQRGDVRLLSACINREAVPMHWKGKQIEPGTGRVK